MMMNWFTVSQPVAPVSQLGFNRRHANISSRECSGSGHAETLGGAISVQTGGNSNTLTGRLAVVVLFLLLLLLLLVPIFLDHVNLWRGGQNSECFPDENELDKI